MQKIGKEATNASKAAEQGAQRAARSTADWGKAASAIGLGLGALTGIAIKLGNESEVVNERLKQSVENAGDSYDELKDKIDAAAESALSLGFDDEDALAALAKLTDATGDTAEAIDALALAEDIARARGISLGAAADIVTKASLGQYGALKRVGIVIDENATKEEALAAIQTKYAGQADAYADTNAAAWDRIGNTIENKLEGIGGALADFQLPLLAIGAGAQAIGPLGDAFTAIGGKAKLASLGVGAMNLALGPVGLVAAGIAAAGAIYYLTTRESDHEKQTRLLSQATDEYTASLVANTTALANLGLLDAADAIKTYLDTIIVNGADAQERIDSLSGATGELFTEMMTGEDIAPIWERLFDAGIIDEYTAAILKMSDVNYDGQISATELAQAQIKLHEGFEATAGEAAKLTEAVTAATLASADPQLFGGQILDETSRILHELGLGYIDVGEAIKLINALPTDRAFNRAADAAGDATTSVDGLNKAMAKNKEVADRIASGSAKFASGSKARQDAIDAQRESAKALSDELDALAISLEFDAGGAAAAAYDRVVGFTSGMVGAIQTSKDWADALIGPVDVFSELDNMLANGVIDIEDYNEAQQAQVDITDDLTRSTEAMNKIQVKQADSVADGTKATADYLENIAKLDEAEQALALAWADSDLAGRAMDIADMATEFGNMDVAQQTAFENMVLSAAATDPELARVLEDLGLIIEDVNDPTGYKLSIDSSKSQTDVEILSGGIGALITVLGEAYGLDVDAILNDSQFWDDYNNLPDRKTIYLDFTDGGYGPHALGGMVPYPDTAALGRVSGGNMTLVGEHGPELVRLNGGDMVIPNHASRYMDKGKGGGGVTFNGPITVIANDPQSFMRQMREYQTTMERR